MPHNQGRGHENMSVLQVSKAVLFLLLFFFCERLNAQEYTQTQNRIKSIYVYNFIKDVQWPGTVQEGEFKICLLEKNDFYDELEKLASTKKVNDRKLSVHQLSSLAKCNTCDVIFIEELLSVKNVKRDENCKSLIITYGFYEKNLSNIVLMFQDNKLQFSINNPLCDKFGFKVSSHLSSLANPKIIQQP